VFGSLNHAARPASSGFMGPDPRWQSNAAAQRLQKQTFLFVATESSSDTSLVASTFLLSAYPDRHFRVSICLGFKQTGGNGQKRFLDLAAPLNASALQA
jgi:hypothetical protein